MSGGAGAALRGPPRTTPSPTASIAGVAVRDVSERQRGGCLAAKVAAHRGVCEARADAGQGARVVSRRVAEAEVVVALVADLGDEDVR